MANTDPREDQEKSRQPDIVLIHGFRGAPSGLEDVASILRSVGYNVHVPAIPPFAGAGTLNQYTPQTYAQYLRDFIQDKSLEQPILIGHSMGATVAAATAEFFPQLLDERLILMSPITAPPAKPIQLITPLSAYCPRFVVDYATTKFLYVPRKDKALFHKVMSRTKDCSISTRASRKNIHRAANFSARYSIRDFTIPKEILIIAGENDRIVSQKHTKKLAKELQAKLSFISGSGHLHNYERPTDTAQLILNFLNKNT